MKVRYIIDDERPFKFEDGITVLHKDTSISRETILGMDVLDELWLDHDLGSFGDIRSFVKWLEEELHFDTFPVNIKKVFVHTSNPSGRDWIISTLEKYLDVEVIDPVPFLEFK